MAKSNTGDKRKDGGENHLRLGAPGNANEAAVRQDSGKQGEIMEGII